MRARWFLVLAFALASSLWFVSTGRAQTPAFTFPAGDPVPVMWDDIVSGGARIEFDNNTARAQTVIVLVRRLKSDGTPLCKPETPQCVTGVAEPAVLPAGDSGTIVLKADEKDATPTADSFTGRLSVVDERTEDSGRTGLTVVVRTKGGGYTGGQQSQGVNRVRPAPRARRVLAARLPQPTVLGASAAERGSRPRRTEPCARA